MRPCRYGGIWRRRHPPHTCPTPAPAAYIPSQGKLKRVPGPTCSATVHQNFVGLWCMIPQTTQMRALAGGVALRGLFTNHVSRSSTESDFWHTVLRWSRKRMSSTFSSIEREMGLVESSSISTRTSSTKHRMLESLMPLTRLFSGLFRPEYLLPVSLAPQGIGASFKLILWEGSILVT
jgi:hypothetical protein